MNLYARSVRETIHSSKGMEDNRKKVGTMERSKCGHAMRSGEGEDRGGRGEREEWGRDRGDLRVVQPLLLFLAVRIPMQIYDGATASSAQLALFYCDNFNTVVSSGNNLLLHFYVSRRGPSTERGRKGRGGMEYGG